MSGKRLWWRDCLIILICASIFSLFIMLWSFSIPNSAPVTNDQVTKDQVTTGQVTKDQMTTGQVTKDQVTKDQVTMDQVTKNQVTKDQVTMDQMTKGQVTNKEKLSKTPEAVFAERRQRIQDICMNDPDAKKGGLRGIYTHKPSGVIYCYVPKAGCTFWKRIFYGVNQGKDTMWKVFSRFSRMEVHIMAQYGVPYIEEKHGVKNYPIRFTVARDPFSRLLSSYLDKFYLPDFWTQADKRKTIIPVKNTGKIDFMRSHFDSLAVQYDKNFTANSTSKVKKCWKYITFAQFVQDSLVNKETHWDPISTLCNPCKFNVTNLSYMETFPQDAAAILDRLGLHGYMDNKDRDYQVIDEFELLTEYNFAKLREDKRVYQCTSAVELAYRLWNNFKWRGYIDPKVDYVAPISTDATHIEKNLLQQLVKARNSGIKNRAELKAFATEFRKQIYLTLPKNVFQELLKKYALDIKLYGYESKRDKMISLMNNVEG
ncbi:hypothetical protein EGW08_015445 [Elysia chlorotica]|uniref:Carbohydrate sulfotransferase n=1 Tax=Elysia chlorotica TaxID=188477 RepID=A0A3S0ZW88_ELYCH|nr:hypothetical protein EGW08_015445 [Elysia chlorotica]